jgi:L-ascorbate metabolism protein UlaG (beta-lactamase superfamily)
MSLNSEDIYHTRLEQGLAMAWVNSYSAVVVKTPGATLLFDPVSVAVPEDARIDAIAISHEHSDHWDPHLVTELQRRTGALIATTPYLASRLAPLLCKGSQPSPPAPLPAGEESQVSFPFKPLQPGDSLTIGDVRLTALRCDHAARQTLAFLAQTSEQITVYLPGDGTPFPEMKQLSQQYHPDILLWMGTMLEDGAKIAELAQPKVLVTYAINPPVAGKRAQSILTRLTPEIQFFALERHQVFRYLKGVLQT